MIFADWGEGFVLTITLVAVLTILFVSIRMSPSRTYLAWGLVLIGYVIWPFEPSEPDQRVGLSIPVEYVPLLIVFAAGAVSGQVRKGLLVTRLPKALVASALGIILYGAASSLWVPDLGPWFSYFTMWVTYLLLLFTMVSGLSQESPKRLAEFLSKLLLLLTAFVFSVIVRNAVHPSARFGSEEFGLWDFTPVIRYRISQTLTVLPFVPVATMLYFVTRRFKYLIFVAAACLVILASYGRAGIVGLASCLVLCAALWAFDSQLRAARSGAPVLALLAMAIIATSIACYLGKDTFINRVLSVTAIGDVWSGNLSPGQRLWGRQVILQEAMRIFSERPWLGTGVGNYQEFIDPAAGRFVISPHNLYLTYLSEFGIIGFVPLIGFLISLTCILWNKAMKASTPHARAILQGFAVTQTTFFIMFFATDFLVSPYVWFFWGIALSFALSRGVALSTPGLGTATESWRGAQASNRLV